MSARNDFSTADWVKRRLTELRCQLEQSGELPKSSRPLWDRVRRGAPQPAPAVEDARVQEMARAALDGVDIEATYPAFFDRLIADKTLQGEFLRAMSHLEAQLATESRSPLDSRPPSRIESAPKGWRIIWQLTAAQIQAAFAWQRQNLAYRDMPAQALTPSRFLLLQSHTEVMGDEAAIALNAHYQAESPDALQLSVSTGWRTARPISLQLRVGWGAYDQTILITTPGEQPLPAAALDDLLDETGEHFQHDLRLILEAHPLEAAR
ncbi:MAG: hypothetical protein Fur0021_29460 [Candidatus Promineifilaceae bacterium]